MEEAETTMKGKTIGAAAREGVTGRAASNRPAILEGLSTLLTYPRGDFRATLPEVMDLPDGAGRAEDAPVAALIRAFGRATAELSGEEMEELYTRTFDLNPDASLETGWQLYGEAYERGAFLVKMRELLRAYGVPESGELPDHLALILKVMGRMPEADAAALATSYIRKAVEKMIAAFKDDGNPYLNLLKAASLAAGGMVPRKESAQS